MGCAAGKVQPVGEKTEHAHQNGGVVPSTSKSTASRSRSLFPLLRRNTTLSRGGTPSLPPPIPPEKRKVEIFNPDFYKDIDQYARQVPEEMFYGTFEDMAKYLTAHLSTDLERVRAVFTFVASIDLDELQHKYHRLPDAHTPLDYLLKIHWDMGNHAYIFAVLCRAASLPCFLVTGTNKSAAYRVGSPIDREAMAAQWNAVLVDQQWRLCDVFWASMCVVGRKSRDWDMLAIDGDMLDETSAGVANEGEEGEDEDGKTEHYVNEFFFLTDPDWLISTHLPDKDLWQMLPESMTEEQFERTVYVRERFFHLGIEWNDNSKRECVVYTERGEAEITFGIPTENARNIQFRYILFKERASLAPSASDTNSQNSLDRYVFYQKTLGGTVMYRAVFPVAGRFKMDIFGLDTTLHENLDLVCSYIIQCDEPREGVQPLPDIPDIGWGPGPEAAEKGMKPVSHEEGVIYSKDGKVEIAFETENPLTVLQNLRHNELDELLLSRHAVVNVEDGEMKVDIRLPREGEYALNLFADDNKAEGDVPNVVNYLIRCEGDEPGSIQTEPYPKLHDGILGRGQYGDKLGVEPVTHASGKMATDDGTVKTSFQVPENVDIFCEMHSNTTNTKRMAEDVQKTVEEDGTVTFEVDLKRSGEYGMNVYAKEKGEGKQMYHVHTYLVQNDGEDASDAEDYKVEQPPVDSSRSKGGRSRDPMSELGASSGRINDQSISLAEQYKNLNLPQPKTTPKENFNEMDEFAKTLAMEVEKSGNSNMNVMTMSTHKDEIEIKLPHHDHPILAELTRKNAQDPVLEDQIQWRVDQDQEVMNVKLPQFGEYKLDIYETMDNGALMHVNTYNLWRAKTDDLPGGKNVKNRHPKYLELQYRALRKQLRLAISSGNPEYLGIAIKECEENGVPDPNDDISKSKRLMQFWKIRDELKASMALRQLKRLDEAVKAAERAGMVKHLGLQMAMARRIQEHLQGIEKIRHAILNLDQRTIAEIKSYSQPPDAVHHVMAAVYVLLGETEENLKDWQAIKYLIGRTGKMGLKRLVGGFKVPQLKIETALQAYLILKKFTLDDVKDISVGVATFYVWARKMIEECESQFTQQGGDIKDVGFKPLRLFSAKRNQAVPGMTHQQTVLLAKQRTLSAKLRTMKAKQLAMKAFNHRTSHPAEKYRNPLEKAQAEARQAAPSQQMSGPPGLAREGTDLSQATTAAATEAVQPSEAGTEDVRPPRTAATGVRWGKAVAAVASKAPQETPAAAADSTRLGPPQTAPAGSSRPSSTLLTPGMYMAPSTAGSPSPRSRGPSRSSRRQPPASPRSPVVSDSPVLSNRTRSESST